jgi:hypothetical protein
MPHTNDDLIPQIPRALKWFFDVLLATCFVIIVFVMMKARTSTLFDAIGVWLINIAVLIGAVWGALGIREQLSVRLHTEGVSAGYGRNKRYIGWEEAHIAMSSVSVLVTSGSKKIDINPLLFSDRKAFWAFILSKAAHLK